MKMNTGKRFSLVILLAVILGGCSLWTTKPETMLYDRLGGKPAITAVVTDFMALIGEDPRIHHAPTPQRIPVVTAHLIDMVCQATGGPCTYAGRDMKSAHTGLGITGAEFEAVVEDLVKVLDKYQVPEREKNELLALLAPMRPDIVEVQAEEEPG
jgi:hemoglobin